MAELYGSRLMPVVVDETAERQPDLPYASVPLTTNISDGFKDVTFSDIASATNKVARWIENTIGRSSNFDTIAYMGVGDLRYVVVFLAAVKCGYKVLLPSLRNSPWMNGSLFEQTKCVHLFFAPEVEPVIRPLLDHHAIPAHPITPLETLIQKDTPHYPFTKSYEEAKWDPILILHSSGSTGPPRPIYMNHNTFAVGDNDRNLPIVPGRVNQNWSLWDFPENEHFFSPFPAFHLAGFSSMVMLPIYYPHATLVLSPPSRPPSGHLVSEIMDHFTLKSIFCPPIIAEQIIQEPGGLEKLKSLKFLLYAGGPLSQVAGDALSKVTDVCQFYGQTETGAIQALVPKREDWASLEWHPKQEVTMESSIDGTFEMIMHRNPALEGIRNVSCNFPDVEVWRTKDLFKPHPTKPGLWRFHGRADDIIVLSNGEKFNPVPSETQISAHPLLSGALIIGHSRPQPSLILEPKDLDNTDTLAIIEQVWPTIEKANAEAPGHARVTRDMVLVSSKDKPFDRSPKGTIIRASTGAKYEDQISELYSRDISRNLQHITLDDSSNISSIVKFVKQVVGSAFPKSSFNEGDDLFVLGLDSLQATEIISLLKAGITAEKQRDVSWVSPKFIYENPSVNAISEAIQHKLTYTNGVSQDQPDPLKRQQKMESILQKYVKGSKTAPISGTPVVDQPPLHVILTGSTGSLGTHLLIALVADPKVAKISCLDRSADAKERVTRSLSSWPKPIELDSSRVSFYQADYSKPDFGLPATTFTDLRENASLIIHNAWKVDFNHALASFEAVHIRGVRNFVDFSVSSRHNPRIVFVSSISSVGNWHSAVETKPQSTNGVKVIPEEIAQTPAVAQSIGYAESKAIAEQILAAAAENEGVKASIVRVGQIAGPIGESGGKWNENEWFPLLLKTSKNLGKIPDASLLDNVDWLPVDALATVLLELSLSEDNRALQVYHLVNPKVKSWTDLLPAVQEHIGNPKAVSMQDWVSELERVNGDDHDAIAANPAVKILDFFKDSRNLKYIGADDVDISTKNAKVTSPTLSQLGPVQASWMKRWMQDWSL
ncbi:acetyl-CoA synthetase-like protein [Aaosphaeria arxii CBS 175.79]|uniref:Acetyl-CoA synthetase-like protein n=1 Tax=Aaosphaeria arxii CBS 175.79 TaxID=1450172 RepID=A0A6A5XIY9_9PLEO|nr:acetyl-CoA synthetase-like protein [Aaosphaeria arxii CBS 175.79]KAF2012923.1 acetyl-CoA synthetase-like protein [Aaosphaeria arxii CBS 175.79]